MSGMFTIVNAYGDHQVHGEVPVDPLAFEAQIKPILEAAGRGVWLRLSFATHAQLLPLARDLGFTAHSVHEGVLTLQCWRRPAERNPTPRYAHHALGCAACIVNARGQVLAIKERYDATGLWHLPGGHVDPVEDVVSAAMREAQEEAGVAATPVGLLALRDLPLPVTPAGVALTAEDVAKMEQSTRFGTTHMCAFVLGFAAGEPTPAADAAEISEVAWLEPAAFLAAGHDHEALLLRCAVETGQIAGAAQLAAGALPFPPAAPFPHLVSQHGVDARHKRWAGVTFPCTYLHAYPDAVFAAAAASVASTVAAKHLVAADPAPAAAAGPASP